VVRRMNGTLDEDLRSTDATSVSDDVANAVCLTCQNDDLHAEETLFFNDPASKLRCIIAIDPAGALPALGGCSLIAGLDNLRALQVAAEQARRTTRKLLLARLPFAGAHAVLLRQPGVLDRSALFTALGHAVARAQGRCIVMQDEGTTAQDMLIAGRQTPFIASLASDDAFACRPESEIAFGVFIAMEEALQRLGLRMNRSTVAVSGLEGAGMPLCERLHDAGAALLVSDTDPYLAYQAQRRFGARVVDARDLPAQRCDVFAPCVPAALDAEATSRITAALVCGTADAPLVSACDGDALHARGVVYLPDILVNVGGLISAACSRREMSGRHAWLQEIAGIGRRVHDLFDQLDGRAPFRLVDEWVRERRSSRIVDA
jgi:leucine dehydrogenase